MAAEDAQSAAELRASLAEYQEQLQGVKSALQDTPNDEELQEVQQSLGEVIQLTQDLLQQALEAEQQQRQVHPPQQLQGVPVQPEEAAAPSEDVRAPAAVELPEEFAVGKIVEAVWSEDKNWYQARVEEHTPLGARVTFLGYKNQEEVPVENLRAPQSKKRKELTDEEILSRQMPKSFSIMPGDTDEEKAKKRKMIHGFKSKQRFAKQATEQKQKQSAWMDFQNAKGGKKKVR